MSNTFMKRTASMHSLPSPPADASSDVQMDSITSSFQAKQSTRLPRAPKRPYLDFMDDGEEEEEIDELEDEENSESQVENGRIVPQRGIAKLVLGSPVNVGGGAGGARTTRKQLLNPFFLADNKQQPSSSSSFPSQSTTSAEPSTSSLSTSPTRHPRRRVDPDRIKLTASNITPPQKSRSQLQEDRLRQEQEEVLKKKQREMMGWDDPENPFLDKDDEMFKRTRSQSGQPPIRRPETLTYVKRGERIRTSIPFTAVLTSSSPSEDPFTYTTPKLLFPPTAPKTPQTPPSSFLEALRSSVSRPAQPEKKEEIGRDELPPTPVTLKRKPSERNVGLGGAGKRMKLPNSEAEHQGRGLNQSHHYRGLR